MNIFHIIGGIGPLKREGWLYLSFHSLLSCPLVSGLQLHDNAWHTSDQPINTQADDISVRFGAKKALEGHSDIVPGR